MEEINSIKELSKNTLTSMADIYEKEIKENSKIEVTAENVTVEKGKYTTVTVRCESDVEAFLTGSLSESGIISAKFRKQSGGATIIITGIKSGDAQINLKLRTSSGSIITEKTINVTVE